MREELEVTAAAPPADGVSIIDLSLSWVEEIERRGYDVIGEVTDLVGAEPEAASPTPTRPPERAVAGAAVDAIRALLLENARLRGEEARLSGELRATREELDRAYVRPSYVVRQRAVRRLFQRRRSGLLGVYRRLRGRNWRLA